MLTWNLFGSWGSELWSFCLQVLSLLNHLSLPFVKQGFVYEFKHGSPFCRIWAWLHQEDGESAKILLVAMSTPTGINLEFVPAVVLTLPKTGLRKPRSP